MTEKVVVLLFFWEDGGMHAQQAHMKLSAFLKYICYFSSQSAIKCVFFTLL